MTCSPLAVCVRVGAGLELVVWERGDGRGSLAYLRTADGRACLFSVGLA